MFIVLLLAISAAAQSCAHHGPIALATRPTFSNGTDTVQCGLAELEYGYSRQYAGGTTTAAISSTVLMGVTPRIDLRWSLDNVLFTGATTERSSGIGDAWLGARYRFKEQHGRFPALGVLYQLKLPLASTAKQQGSGYVDHSLALLASKDFGRTHFDMNAVQTASGSAHGMRNGTMGGLAVSMPIRGRLSGTLELYGGKQEITSGALLTALSWRWSDRLLTDVGVERGFWGSGSRTRLTFGMTYAVKDLYRLFSR